MPMIGARFDEPSEFQRTVGLQIALYEADLETLRLEGADPDEISAFEVIVGELRRLQHEDLADLAQAEVWHAASA